MAVPDLRVEANPDKGYYGLIASATSNAANWTVLVEIKNKGMYFNQISCLDENNCWAVGEGVNASAGTNAAWIYATTDGWQSHTVQHYFQGGSLIAIQMLSPTYGIAAGALLPSESSRELQGAFFSTTDGETWTQQGSILGFYALDISVVDENNAFAAGIGSSGLASLARYAVQVPEDEY